MLRGHHCSRIRCAGVRLLRQRPSHVQLGRELRRYGEFGSSSDSAAGVLCTRVSAAGGHQYNGAHLSWGWDLDGAATGTSAISAIEVRDTGGASTIATLSGVLASISIDGSGNITTNSGEFRRALASPGGGCFDHIRYDGTRISCGSLTVGRFAISGNLLPNPIPVPGALLLLGSALGAFGWLRRRGG